MNHDRLPPPILDTIQTADPHLVPVRLSRNFGHQSAVSAGLDQAQFDAIQGHRRRYSPETLRIAFKNTDLNIERRLEPRGSPSLVG